MAKFNLSLFKRKPLTDVKYEPLPGDHDSCSKYRQPLKSVNTDLRKGFLFGACAVLALFLSLSLITVIYFSRRVSTNASHDQQALVKLFGEIPMVDTLFVEDPDFVGSDPHDGAWDIPGSYQHTVWDDIYLGAWIEVTEPANIGLSGGVPMRFFNGDHASAEGEAYVVSMLHQLHCIGELKHVFMEYERTQKIATLHHVTHCVEYLRQAVMCNADLAVERPETLTNKTFTGSSGWDAIHHCRDWSTVYNLLSSHRIR